MAKFFDVLTGYMEQIDIKKVSPSSHPIRSGEDSLDDLIVSIREKGLLEPIVVRPIGERFEVVAGNRRLEACKRAMFTTIACHVVELDDAEAYEMSLIENLQRKTLNPLEEAEAFQKYVREYGYGGMSDLAKRIGKSHTYVSRRIALLSLPDSVKEGIVRRRTTPSVANELAPLAKENIGELLELVSGTSFATRKEVRMLVKHVEECRERRGTRGETQARSYYELEEVKMHIIDRTIGKCIASVKEDMARLDNAMGHLNDKDQEEWGVKEALTWCRHCISGQVDDMLKLRKKFRYRHKV